MNFLRLVLAAAVLVSHVFPVSGYSDDPQIGDLKLGTAAVLGFFAISGYLIAGSRNGRGFWTYLRARALRIFPAFWLCVVLTAIVFAPLASLRYGAWDLHSAIRYVMHAVDLRVTQPSVGRTLEGAPFPYTWNGSLWTLQYEFGCYLVLAAVFLLPRRWLTVRAAIGVFVLAQGLGIARMIGIPGTNTQLDDVALLVPYFAAGALMYAVRNRLQSSAKLAGAAAGILVLALIAHCAAAVGPLPTAYLCLWGADALPAWAKRINARNDISYGFYLFGFPVTQLVVAAVGARERLLTTGLALPITTALAWMSWHVVEKRALSLKGGSARRQRFAARSSDDSSDEQPLILVLGTADWNQAIATNQHYVTRELSVEFSVIFTESMGLRTPELKMRDLRRIARRLGLRSGSVEVHPRPVPSGTQIRSPKVIPKHTGIAYRLNRPRVHKLVQDWIVHPGPRILWTYTPVTYGLEDYASAVIYHCVDLLREGAGISADLIDTSETHLAECGAQAIGTSPLVIENLGQRGFTNVIYWPNVADTSVIEAAQPPMIERSPGRLVFAGNLIPNKVDFELLDSLISAGYDVHLAGPIADGAGGSSKEAVAALVAGGATYHGMLSLPELADLYWTAEVGLIPYVINGYTKGVSPLKTYEYLAAGLGVVSTPVPSVQGVPGHVEVRDNSTFLTGLAVLKDAGAPDRTALAQANSWGGRGNEVRAVARVRCEGMR